MLILPCQPARSSAPSVTTGQMRHFGLVLATSRSFVPIDPGTMTIIFPPSQSGAGVGLVSEPAPFPFPPSLFFPSFLPTHEQLIPESDGVSPRGQRNLISIASASAVDAGPVTARGHARETLRRGRGRGGTGVNQSGIQVEEFHPPKQQENPFEGLY